MGERIKEQGDMGRVIKGEPIFDEAEPAKYLLPDLCLEDVIEQAATLMLTDDGPPVLSKLSSAR